MTLPPIVLDKANYSVAEIHHTLAPYLLGVVGRRDYSASAATEHIVRPAIYLISKATRERGRLKEVSELSVGDLALLRHTLTMLMAVVRQLVMDRGARPSEAETEIGRPLRPHRVAFRCVALFGLLELQTMFLKFAARAQGERLPEDAVINEAVSIALDWQAVDLECEYLEYRKSGNGDIILEVPNSEEEPDDLDRRLEVIMAVE